MKCIYWFFLKLHTGSIETMAPYWVLYFLEGASYCSMSIMKRSLTVADNGPFYNIRNKKPIGNFTIFIQKKNFT